MELPELQFSKDELRRAISAVDLNAVDWPLCEHFVTPFGRAIESHADLRAALQFLAIACGWWLRPDDPESPFDPAFQSEATRSPVWQQVSDAQIAILTAVAQGVTDAELRARLCDLVWLRARSHSFARTAATSYVQSAKRLIAGNKVNGEKERLTRAVQLAAQIGKSDGFLTEVVEDIAAISETPELLHCELATCLEVLLDVNVMDVERLHELATARALIIESTERNTIWERKFWELASSFSSVRKDTPSRELEMRKVAETFEREAESAPMQAVAAHFWHCALQVYRKINARDDADRVHRRMLDAQSHIQNEMIAIDGGTVDLTQLVCESRAQVVPDDKPRSLANLVFATQWLSKADIRAQSKARVSDFPLQNLFGSVRVTGSGKTAATAPSVDPNAPQLPESRWTAEMCQEYRYFVPIVANGRIEPMRYELIRQHAILLDDIASLVFYSPFVPPGREAFFVVGLHAGVHGRFIEAIHILIPQIESSIRYLLLQSGSVASSVRADGIQEEFDLNRLLALPKTESILGEDLTFALRVLFTERFGYNMRNELAHGMLEPGVLFSDAAVYAWWLILRVVCGPAANAILSDDSE